MGKVIANPNNLSPAVIIEYEPRKESVIPMFRSEIDRIRSLRNSLNSNFFSLTCGAALTVGIAIRTDNLSQVWVAIFIALSTKKSRLCRLMCGRPLAFRQSAI